MKVYLLYRHGKSFFGDVRWLEGVYASQEAAKTARQAAIIKYDLPPSKVTIEEHGVLG